MSLVASGRANDKSDTDSWAVPAQLKTKTIPCKPKLRLKHYLVPCHSLSASVHPYTCLKVQPSIDSHG